MLLSKSDQYLPPASDAAAEIHQGIIWIADCRLQIADCRLVIK
jgi:hypothetical protein